MADTNYVTRGMCAKCSLGTMENKLNLPKDHGILYKDDESPVMNANDHEPLKHVIHFGRCCSCMNPENISRSMASGGLILIGNAISTVQAKTSTPLPGSSIIKSITGSVSCKCSPKTFKPWENVSVNHFVEGAPAIISESQLTCIYGGVITIIEKEEKEEEKEEEEKEEEEKEEEEKEEGQQNASEE